MYNDKPWARATETSANECKRKHLEGYFFSLVNVSPNHSIMKKGGGDKSILSDILRHLNHANTDVETWMEEVKFQFEFEIQFNLDIFFSLSLCIHTGFGIASCLVRANEQFNLTGGCLNILKG